MAKKKKTKIGNGQIITMGMALVSIALAIVGLFIPYFSRTLKSSVAGTKSTTTYGLFDETVTDLSKNLDTSVALVRTFAIIAVVLAVLAAVCAVLVSLRILPRNGLIKFIFSGVTIVMGVLALVFTFTFCAQFAVDGGTIAQYNWTAGAGAYLLGIGSILGGVTLLLSKK